MNYFILRDGQEFGPYTLGDLQRYLLSGNVLATDMARSDGMPQPMMVSQILGTVPIPVQAPAQASGYGQASGYAQPGMPLAAGSFNPDPPNLHWALVLLFTMLSCGIFYPVWCLIQSSWMKKVDPQSKAIGYYIAVAVIFAIYLFASIADSVNHGLKGVVDTIYLIFCVVCLIARFNFRTSIEQYYNTVEPIGLTLSGVMTFFFGEIYFQYHFTQINERKKLARMSMGQP